MGNSGQSDVVQPATTTTTIAYNTMSATVSSACLAVLIAAVPIMLAQDTTSTLSAGVEEILSAPYVDSFDCNGQEYGYYADIDNNCEVFHICVPIRDFEDQVIETSKYTFVCPNGTAFDQEYLICNHKDKAFPCEESASMYGAIAFGVKL